MPTSSLLRSGGCVRLQWLLLVLAAVISLFVEACSASPTPVGPSSTLVTQPPSSLTPSTTAIVKITEMPAGTYIFSPETLKIKAGTEVVWTNDTFPAHTVTSDTGAFKGSSPFGQHETFMMIFTHTGTFKYHCALHIYMKGTVIVS